MATPLVAGGAVVVREYLIKRRSIAQPSAALVKAVMMNTAFDMYPGQFGATGRAGGQELLTKRPTADAGWGRVDMDRATDLGQAVLVDERTGLGVGEQHKYPIRVSRSGKLTATLVYTDAPAAASAAKALVNDLDVELVTADGAVVLAPADRVNNSELIETEISAGDYELRVKGVNVPQGLNGKQPYAMVISVN